MSGRSRRTFGDRIETEISNAISLAPTGTDHGTRLRALVANESATQEAFHESDRVYCSLHLDDLVIDRTSGLSGEFPIKVSVVADPDPNPIVPAAQSD